MKEHWHKFRQGYKLWWEVLVDVSVMGDTEQRFVYEKVAISTIQSLPKAVFQITTLSR
jgi:hypothetical protein